ncbi:MAG: hypothetical protein ABFS86_19230 [Planctomycetota bacterium]
MRTPTILACLALLLILTPACESTGGTTPPSSDEPGANRDSPEPADFTEGVTGRPIRVEWRSLNPRDQGRRMGLINQSSPDLVLLYRKKEQFRDVKPVDDEVMADVLSAVRKADFYDHATKGMTADDFQVGDGHGVVWVQNGDENWTLLFSPATGAADSSLPRAYRDIKVLTLRVWNATLWFSTTTQGGEGSFRIQPHKHGQPKK